MWFLGPRDGREFVDCLVMSGKSSVSQKRLSDFAETENAFYALCNYAEEQGLYVHGGPSYQAQRAWDRQAQRSSR